MSRGSRPRGLGLRDPACALLSGEVELWQLARPLADLYHLGFFDGRGSLGGMLLEAQSAADRYYRLAFTDQRAVNSVPQMSFPELCRIRGELALADAAERSLAARFASSVDVV